MASELTKQEKPEDPRSIAETLQKTGIFDAKEVGRNTVSAISIMGKHEKLAGNVLRRLCRVGEKVCGKACDRECVAAQLKEKAQENIDARCAEENLRDVINRLGVKQEKVLMVGVSVKEDNVGFAEEIDSHPEKYSALNRSPVLGAKELPGFNAFFAREGDKVKGEEVIVLGRRLADCGDINLEFVDRDGFMIMGFMHMTRANLQGEGAEKYEYKGKKVGSFEYFMRTALDHYGAHESTVKLKVAAAIKPENYIYTLSDENKMDEFFPGWKVLHDENGTPFMNNLDRPDWKPGDEFAPSDKWEIDFGAMLRWQISRVPGIKSWQINWEGAIDPGDADSRHASNTRGSKDAENWQGRDAYFTAWADKLQPII